MLTLALQGLLISALLIPTTGWRQQSSLPALQASPKTAEAQGVLRGWLSDEQCARGRAEGGAYTGTNPQCAKECVAKGRKIVLIDPERKMIFTIANQQLAKDHIGDYVEISGRTDVQAKTIQIASLKMVEKGVAECGRTQKLPN